MCQLVPYNDMLLANSLHYVFDAVTPSNLVLYPTSFEYQESRSINVLRNDNEIMGFDTSGFVISVSYQFRLCTIYNI
jgi:hypothetical protein